MIYITKVNACYANNNEEMSIGSFFYLANPLEEGIIYKRLRDKKYFSYYVFLFIFNYGLVKVLVPTTIHMIN